MNNNCLCSLILAIHSTLLEYTDYIQVELCVARVQVDVSIHTRPITFQFFMNIKSVYLRVMLHSSHKSIYGNHDCDTNSCRMWRSNMRNNPIHDTRAAWSCCYSLGSSSLHQSLGPNNAVPIRRFVLPIWI